MKTKTVHDYLFYFLDIALLSKLKHLALNQVSSAFLSVDDSIITESLLVNLQAYVPTAEEQGKLSVFVKSASDEDLEQLSKPDSFCVEVSCMTEKRIRTETHYDDNRYR